VTRSAPPDAVGSGRSEAGARRRRLRPLVPLALILAVSLLEVATGAEAVVLSLVVVAPLIAATFLSARATALYALVAVAAGAALGLYAGQLAQERLVDQAIRLATIAVAGALAIVGAHLRSKREARLTQVLRVAAAAQEAVLPPLPATVGPLALAASYDSAADEADVGGDTYAAEQTAHGVRLLIADVRGHGLDAVRLAAAVLGAFRERAHDAPDLSTLAVALDRSVRRLASDEDFATGVLVQVQDGTLVLANAGHAAPLLLRAGTVTGLSDDRPSPPFGLGARPDVVTVALVDGDRLVLFTDGATEARRPSDGSFFDLETAAAAHLGRGPLAEGLTGLRDALLAWTQVGLHDDVTVLVAEYRAPAPPGT
jgi:serine phosphatase RsbU (regulator of sigma subunit)